MTSTVLVLMTLLSALPAMEIPPPSTAPGSGALGASGLPLPAPPFLAAPLWDDGLAEVCTYALNQRRYGALHPGGSATIITVREFVDPLRVVKSTDGTGIPVLKCHLVKSFATGVYRYEQAVTTLSRRADAMPLRLFINSHEWCGSAAKTWINRGPGSLLRSLSYFDGHGDWEQPLDPGTGASAALLDDQLWLWLRAWLSAGATPLTVPIIPTQLEARVQSTVAVPTAISADAAANVTVAAGTFSARTVHVGDARYVIEAAMPHRLLTATAADGTRLELSKCRRFAYWTQHFPADAPAPAH